MDDQKKNDCSGSFLPDYLYADEVLQELKDRALDAAAEGVVISDPSLPDNPIIYVNSGFQAMTGYRADEVLGKNCRFLQGPKTGQPASEKIRRAIAEDRPCVVELLNHRKDGSTFWNRLSITPVRDAAGKTTHFIGVQSDITRRREAEQSLREANEQLAAANATMKRALTYAAGIQQSLLPAKPLRDERFEAVGKLIACEELAGDTLNYFLLDDHRVGFYVLDVVGHGVPAALMSVSISRLLTPHSGKSCLFESTGPQQKAGRILSPAQVGRILNDVFSENIGSGLFFTIFYGIWDASGSRLTYCSAGHPPAVLIPKDGPAQQLEAVGFPVGITNDPQYRDYEHTMRKGDRLLVYSDGLIEAADAGDQQIGIDRLTAMAQQYRDLPIEACLQKLLSSVRQLQATAHPADDVSLLIFEVTA